MVRWLGWHCPPDTGFVIRALAVWGRARYLSVTEAPHNTNFHTLMGKKQFCFFQTTETGNRTPDSGVKGSGANHYPRAPAQFCLDHGGNKRISIWNHRKCLRQLFPYTGICYGSIVIIDVLILSVRKPIIDVIFWRLNTVHVLKGLLFEQILSI